MNKLLIVPPNTYKPTPFAVENDDGVTTSTDVLVVYVSVMGRHEFSFLNPSCRAISEADLNTLLSAAEDGRAVTKANWRKVTEEDKEYFRWMKREARPFGELKAAHESGENVTFAQFTQPCTPIAP